MAGEWDVVDQKPVSEWDVIAQEPAPPPPPPPPPKRKVGGLETALRTAGSAAQKAVGLFDMAAGGLAGLFSEAEADRVFRMRDERQQAMSDVYAPKANEEMSLPGQIAGGIASAPIEMVGGFGLQHGVDRSAEVLNRGGSLEQAQRAGGVSAAANVAANLLPVKAGGAIGRGLEGVVARRLPAAAVPAAGAVAGGVSGGALGAGANVGVTAAENAALPEGEQFQDLQQEGTPGVAAGLGAAFGAAAGAKGIRTPGLRKTVEPRAEPTPGTQASGGAAGTDLATIREERAAALPVPIKLTKGQKSRKFEDLRFEKETAKDPDKGSRLRENADDQNKKVIENLETFEDMTGREETERGNAGRKVVDALEEKQQAKKAEIRQDYNAAREAGELEAPVDTTALVDYLDKNRSSATNAGVIGTAEAELVRLGGATKDADGNLVPGQLKLNDVEELRKTIGIGGKKDQTNSHFATEMRNKLDAMTEGAGGELYKAARKKYADYAAEFKNQGVVRDILALKKNTTDRTVAFDNVVKRIVLSGDPDDLRAVRRSLNDAGEPGKQAFREIQGQAIKYLRDQATGNAARDSQGRPIVSDAKYAAALKLMDRDGRLDDLLGKQGAQQLRDVGELLKDVYTAPPGVVNTSNTASVLIKWLGDAALSGMTTGVPLPLIHTAKAAKDFYQGRKVRKQIDAALGPDGELPRQEIKPFGVPEEPPPTPRGTDTPESGAKPAESGSADARLEKINALKEGASPETVKVLDAQAKKVERELRAEKVIENRTKEAEQLEATAQATDDPDVRQALLARAKELRPEKIPTGLATEVTPKDAAAITTPAKPLPTGEAKELSADEVEALKPSKRERDLQRLREATTDPEVQKDLDKSIAAERKRSADARRGQEYLRLADQATEPDLRAELEAKAKRFGVERDVIPVPEARELPATPETVRAVDDLKVDAADEAAWRQLYRFGDLDAKTAVEVGRAIRYDAAAVDQVMQQHERSPRVFEREIARIIQEGKARESKSETAGRSSQGLERTSGPSGGGAPAEPSGSRARHAASARTERVSANDAGGQGDDGRAADSPGDQRGEARGAQEVTDTPAQQADSHLAQRADVSPDLRRRIVDRYKVAERIKPKFDAGMRAALNALGKDAGEIKLAEIKGASRATDKILSDYDGNADKIKDLVRGTLVIRDVGRSSDAIASLQKRFGKLIGLRNALEPGSKPVTDDGYRDIKANVVIDGQMAEVQVSVPEMLAAKKVAHPLYVRAEAIKRLADKENRDFTPEEAAELRELETRQRELYAAAWEAATSLRKSDS